MLRRKFLAVGSALLGVTLAGCGGAAETPPPATSQTAEQTSAAREAVTPPRSGPAKATDVADKCSIVSQPQSQSLGADQNPRERESNGRPGCQYQKGKPGDAGWSVFVAVSGESPIQQAVGKNREPNKTSDLGGYPALSYQEPAGCVVYVDISDNGFLISNITKTSTKDPGVDLCGTAESFAEAAIQNLPNA
ncbi:DUF3558 domain-containing protein [Saccharopolyspora hirsuta]|uniref:DUF3558 domain-containing protein n=1 Tax=Saccharopolyspora hirsuta TaxID=1837 RepID=UPI003322AC7B